MTLWRKSLGTIRLVSWALFPSRKKGDSCEPPRAVNSCTAPGRMEVACGLVRHVCASFSSAVDEQGRLEIHFSGCYYPAAFFLMFRLKREGFSRCRAWRDGDGITLTALR